jgi:hypothetical protein
MAKLTKKIEAEIERAFREMEKRDLEQVYELLAEGDREQLEYGIDVFFEILNWDLNSNCENAIFETGYICGLKWALDLLVENKKWGKK